MTCDIPLYCISFTALFQYELIFCLQDEHDAARMFVQTLIDKYPKVDTKTFVGKHCLSSVYTITYWLSVRLPYEDILHSLTYAGIR